MKPLDPASEHRLWYQYYFHTERGRAGLEANRRAFARLLWELWSPPWTFDDSTFARSAASFDNPDFVAVTIQSYRHRFGYAAGDPALDEIEAAACRAAQDRGADNRAAGRGRRRAAAGGFGKAWRPFHRAFHAPRAAGRGSQSATRSAASFCRCGLGIDSADGDLIGSYTFR